MHRVYILMLLWAGYTSCDAGTIDVRILRHARAELLTADEARAIVAAAQELVRTACRKAVHRDCDFNLKLIDPGPSREASLRVFNSGTGRMVPRAMRELIVAEQAYTRQMPPDRAITIRVVPEITLCDPTSRPSDIIRGCTISEMLPGHIFVSLTSRKDPAWIARQAQIWAHEFGHIVDNADHKKVNGQLKPEFELCLMNGSAGLDHVNLDAEECRKFEAYPRVL